MDILTKIKIYILISRRIDYYEIFEDLKDIIIKNYLPWDGDFETAVKLKVPAIDIILKYFEIIIPKKSNKIDKINLIIEYFENIDNLTDLFQKYIEAGGSKILVSKYLDITEKNNKDILFYKKELARLEPRFPRIYDSGYIYCIKNGADYKIGKTKYSAPQPIEKLKRDLYNRYHTPYGFKALTAENFRCRYYERGLSTAEKTIHKYYDKYKKNINTELFIIPDKIENIILEF